MEDFQLDIVLGKGPAARTIRLDLPRFTLVGATTRTGLITGPLRDRFGLRGPPGLLQRGRPRRHRPALGRRPRRPARRRGRRRRSPGARGAPPASPTACSSGCGTTPRCAATAPSTTRRPAHGLELFEVDELGLDKVDRAILEATCCRFGGGPVGLCTLAVGVGEAPETVEDVYEPFLLQLGLLMRTPRGRVAMPLAWQHLGLPVPARLPVARRRSGRGRRIPRLRSGPGQRHGALAPRPASGPARRTGTQGPGREMDVPDYDLPESAIAQVPVEPARRGPPARSPWARTVRAPAGRPTCPALSAPGDVLVVNTSRVVPGPLGRCTRQTGGRPRCCCWSRSPGRPGCLAGPGAPGPAPAAGHRALRPAARPWSRWASGWPTGNRRGQQPGRTTWRCLRAPGPAALHPPPAGRPRALPDRLRRPARERGRAHRRPAPDRRRAGPVPAAGGRGGHARPGRRPGDLPPIKAAPGRGARHALRALPRAAVDLGGLPGGPAGRGRGHHDGAGPGVGRGQRDPGGQDRAVHPPGLPFRRRRRAAHQLPPAPQHPAGAAGGLRRARAGGTCTRWRWPRATGSCRSATP